MGWRKKDKKNRMEEEPKGKYKSSYSNMRRDKYYDLLVYMILHFQKRISDNKLKKVSLFVVRGKFGQELISKLG